MKKILIILFTLSLIMLIGCNSKTSITQSTDKKIANNENIISKTELPIKEEFNVERIPQFTTDKNIKNDIVEKHSNISSRPANLVLTRYKNNDLSLLDKNNSKEIKRRVWIYGYSKNMNVDDTFKLTACIYENNKWQPIETLGEALTIAHAQEINSGNENTMTINNIQPGLYVLKLVTIYSDFTISETSFCLRT